MIFILVFIALFTLMYIFHLKLKHIYKQLENIPGPPLLPFIGNALEFGTNNIDALINMKRLVKQYGPVVRLCIGPQVCILLSEPKYIAQVMNSSESVDKPDFYQLLEAVGGDGIALSSGEKWRKHRKLIEPMFRSKHLAEYMTVFNGNSDKFVEKLKTMANLVNVDVTNLVHDCTMRIIWNTAINADSEGFDKYRTAFNIVFDLSIKRFFSISTRWNLMYKLTRDYRALRKNKSIIQNYIESIIARRKHDLTEKNVHISSCLLLDKLLSLSGNDALTDAEIRDEIKTIIFGGSETIAGAISFGLFELAKHPDVQRKMLEESNFVLGKEKSADVSFIDVQHMRYIECVYKEILRMYPPGPFIIRKLQNEMKFDDLVVPPGAYVIIFIAQAHMSEKDFPDPQKFDPERHFPENTVERHPYSYMPFGGGPRICLGQKYSILEAKVMLTKIIRNFEILPAEPEHEMIYLMAGTLKSANGLPIRLKIREN